MIDFQHYSDVWWYVTNKQTNEIDLDLLLVFWVSHEAFGFKNF